MNGKKIFVLVGVYLVTFLFTFAAFGAIHDFVYAMMMSVAFDLVIGAVGGVLIAEIKH